MSPLERRGVHQGAGGVHQGAGGVHQGAGGLHQGVEGVHQEVGGVHQEAGESTIDHFSGSTANVVNLLSPFSFCKMQSACYKNRVF